MLAGSTHLTPYILHVLRADQLGLEGMVPEQRYDVQHVQVYDVQQNGSSSRIGSNTG